MHYEKLHKDTLKGLQRLVSAGRISALEAKSICQDFIAESEDERIRKHLIDCLKFSLKGAEEQDAAGCIRQKDIEAYKWGIAYLEKQKDEAQRQFNLGMQAGREEVMYEMQKEQKPAEIHIDNPNIQQFDPDVKVTTSDSSASGKELLYVCNKSYNIGYRDGVNSVKPAEWSEEDENALKYLHELISFGFSEKFCDAQAAADMRWWLNTRLKSLRPQPHWKPSKEQMRSLEWWKNYSDILESLYDDLKKL